MTKIATAPSFVQILSVLNFTLFDWFKCTFDIHGKKLTAW